MKLTPGQRYRRFLNRFSSNDHVLVIINADPDAIASAMAVKRLLWRQVTSVSIAHINVIKRPDNIAMIRLLSVKMAHLNDMDLDKFNRFVIVDSQPNHHEAFSRFTPDVIIDHHPDTEFAAPFTDIRPEYGATASIMTEYLKAAKIKPSIKLSTGLLHAIKTDTSNFERQTTLQDLQAFQFLFRLANIHLAKKIEQAELRFDFLKYYRLALNDMRVRRNRVFAHLGPVVNPDVCVLIADFFMKINPVKWSIVSGIQDEQLVIIFRNDGIRKNAGNVAKKSFSAFGSAGGHKSMARAEIAIANIANQVDVNDNKALTTWIINRIEKKV